MCLIGCVNGCHGFREHDGTMNLGASRAQKLTISARSNLHLASVPVRTREMARHFVEDADIVPGHIRAQIFGCPSGFFSSVHLDHAEYFCGAFRTAEKPRCNDAAVYFTATSQVAHERVWTEETQCLT